MDVYLKKTKQQIQLRKSLADHAPVAGTCCTSPRANASRHTAHGRKGDDVFVQLWWRVSLTENTCGLRIIVTLATVCDVRNVSLSFSKHFLFDCFHLTFVWCWKWTTSFWVFNNKESSNIKTLKHSSSKITMSKFAHVKLGVLLNENQNNRTGTNSKSKLKVL